MIEKRFFLTKIVERHKVFRTLKKYEGCILRYRGTCCTIALGVEENLMLGLSNFVLFFMTKKAFKSSLNL